MRLLTHNTLRNNTAEASRTPGPNSGFPLKITATEIRVDDSSDVGEDSEREIMFVKSILGIIDWPALVQVSCCFIVKYHYNSNSAHNFCIHMTNLIPNTTKNWKYF